MPLGSTSKDLELLNRVFAKVASQHTSWPSVGLVVGADAVQAVINSAEAARPKSPNCSPKPRLPRGFPAV